MFSLVLMSTSCCKPDDETPVQTFEQTYPDWKNLTWVSTDNSSLSTTYPKLNITIVGDNISVNQPINATQAYNGSYDGMVVQGTTSGTVGFGMPAEITGTFSKSGSQITLTTKGLSTTSHVYVLQIN